MEPGRKRTLASEQASRYLIGIDLGTTNSVVAYIDTQEAEVAESPGIHVFEVPQLVGPGEVRRLPYLPSFLYFPTESEIASGTLALPWEERPSSIAGVNGSRTRRVAAGTPSLFRKVVALPERCRSHRRHLAGRSRAFGD